MLAAWETPFGSPDWFRNPRASGVRWSAAVAANAGERAQERREGLSHAGFDGDLDPRMSAWGEEILHGHVEIEEVPGGVAGAGRAAGLRVGPSDRARGG